MLRSKNREISIFSMSALDLFASALGAFILIAVALFPYFLNTSRIDFHFPHLDMVICLDVTASMAQEVSGLKKEVGSLAKVLGKLAPSFAIGVVAFGDRGYRTPFMEFKLREMKHSRRNLVSLVRFIDSLEAGGKPGDSNDDPPEAFYGALMLAIQKTQWRSESGKKIIVMITDATAYPEEMQDSIRKARLFSGRGSGYGVSTVYASDSNLDRKVTDFLEKVAKAGRGQAIQEEGTMTTSLLLSLMD